MVAHDADLSFGKKEYSYDTIGTVEINRLNDIIRTAIAQDPDRLGSDLEEFTQRFLFQPLGFEHSRWNRGLPDKFFAYGWESTVRDMARLGLLLLHGGTWSGKRILDEGWVYRMTHPAFEDANTGYGYLTWLNSASNYVLADGHGKQQGARDPCAPVSVDHVFPHGLSEAPDCGYSAPYTCAQGADVGVWFAEGALGQLIVGHPALDLVLVVKNYGDTATERQLWESVRPALVALDPKFRGDEDAFCTSYARGDYTPDLR
jgi:hypothetical protein